MPFRIDKSLIAPALVSLVVVLSYSNGVNGDFVFDDIPLISTDEFYSNPSTSLLDCWKRCYWRKGMDIGQYRPITLLSFLWNARAAGLYSPAFRLVNLLLHILVALLVLKLAPRLGLSSESAIFAALLFAAHPLHSEAVIPATGRAELLCAIFVLLGLLAHVESRENRATDSAPSKLKTAALAALAPLCLLLAGWAKENGLVLLPLCVLYDICLRADIFSRKCKFTSDPPETSNFKNNSPASSTEPELLPHSKRKRFFTPCLTGNYLGFAAALAILAASRIAGTGTLIPKIAGRGIFIDNPVCDAPVLARIATAFHVQGMALLKFLWPATLSHDYSFAQIRPIESLADPLAIFAVLSLLALPAILAASIPPRYRGGAIFIWIAYLLSILPAGNFIVPAGTIFGERLTYLPSVWLCMAFAAAALNVLLKLEISVLSERRFITEFAMGAVVLAALVRTNVRTYDWRNSWTLDVSAAAAAPSSVKAWNNLAVQLAGRGKLNEALAACDKAIAIKSDFLSPRVNRAYYLIALKRYEEAERMLRPLLKLCPNDYDLRNKLAGIEARKGDLKEAAKLLERSLTINPDQKPVAETLLRIKKEIKRATPRHAPLR